MTGMTAAALAVLVGCAAPNEPAEQLTGASDTALDEDSGQPEADASGHDGLRRLAPPRSNVLLIIADDMGVDKLGSYADDVLGYREGAANLPDTPVLDDMAAVGVRFTDAWANPECSPTRAALYTGRHAFRTGVGNAIANGTGGGLERNELTLAEVMVDAGYATGLFGKWHLGENDAPDAWGEESWREHSGETFEHEINPITQGWQRFVGTVNGSVRPMGDGVGGYTDWIAVESECVDCETPEVTVHHREEYATDATINDALEWISRQDDSWFAAVALHAPHSPFELPPEGCHYRAGGDSEPVSTIGVYEEMVECMDLRIGELLDGIVDLDDTLVIFMGDNGTVKEVAEHVFDDERGKYSVYESGVRVPLLIADGRTLAATRPGFSWSADWEHSWRRVERGEVSEPVHVVDLYATIAHIAGADASSGDDSISLVPTLQGHPMPPRRAMLAESFNTDGSGDAALRVGEWKLHLSVRVDREGRACRKDLRLYDLATDRLEMNDQAGERGDVLEAMISTVDARVGQKQGAWLSVPDC